MITHNQMLGTAYMLAFSIALVVTAFICMCAFGPIDDDEP